MKVLIAEDDSASRLILETAIAGSGHEVLVAEDGEQAWRIFRSTPAIDVVVSDWMMPHLDGLDLCDRVRSAGAVRGDYTYYILLTVLDGSDNLRRGVESGVDDYLVKPLDRTQLEARLQSAARLTRMYRTLAEKNEALAEVNTLLREQSRQDPLTGLGNRLGLDEELGRLRDRWERYRHRYCLVLCDLDQFKSYNDRYGHQAGDEALRQVARVLADTCRAGDSAYRYGGEELVAVLPEQSVSGGAAFAERLRRSVQELGIPHPDAAAGVVTISAGVSAVGEGDAAGRPREVLGQADTALYRAKAAGRNRVVSDDDGS